MVATELSKLRGASMFHLYKKKTDPIHTLTRKNESVIPWTYLDNGVVFWPRLVRLRQVNAVVTVLRTAIPPSRAGKATRG